MSIIYWKNYCSRILQKCGPKSITVPCAMLTKLTNKKMLAIAVKYLKSIAIHIVPVAVLQF